MQWHNQGVSLLFHSVVIDSVCHLDAESSREVSMTKVPSASTTLYDLDTTDPEYISVFDQMQSTVREHKDAAGGVFDRYKIIKVCPKGSPCGSSR